MGFDFPVYFTRDVLDPTEPALAEALAQREHRRHRVLAFIDDGLFAAQPDLGRRLAAYAGAGQHVERIELAGTEVVPGGERCKNDPGHLEAALESLHRHAIDRHSFALVLGGGAILDMVGYAAAITHRGVRVVRLPSTALSQADSGLGVKNGVNRFGQKNYLGTFAPPYAVIVDQRLLGSLPVRDRIAGTAEAVKVALVRDGELFAWIGERAARFRDGGDDLHALIRRSAEVHLTHIATGGDPFELGSARPLDYGHWAAHKLESLTANRLRHGEAVAIGMALDAIYAHRIGLAAASLPAALCATLEALGFTLWDDALTRPELIDGLDEFRQHLGGRLCITMLERPGVAVDVHDIDLELMRACIGDLRERRR